MPKRTEAPPAQGAGAVNLAFEIPRPAHIQHLFDQISQIKGKLTQDAKPTGYHESLLLRKVGELFDDNRPQGKQFLALVAGHHLGKPVPGMYAANYFKSEIRSHVRDAVGAVIASRAPDEAVVAYDSANSNWKGVWDRLNMGRRSEHFLWQVNKSLPNIITTKAFWAKLRPYLEVHHPELLK